ncbi:hypothetical protein L345_15846 [Ophiophagus hannah]|uniref:Uncharacterized protein n=1 Tax=Ophiophagus hannah TaxID=8665 RepID=V8NA38_OPHHA|nr:hypothetical protein L345_15846 [Ophiophagus hannah]
MNGGQLYLDLQVLYMKEEFFFLISPSLQIIHLNHQRLHFGQEFIIVILTAKE